MRVVLACLAAERAGQNDFFIADRFGRGVIERAVRRAVDLALIAVRRNGDRNLLDRRRAERGQTVSGVVTIRNGFDLNAIGSRIDAGRDINAPFAVTQLVLDLRHADQIRRRENEVLRAAVVGQRRVGARSRPSRGNLVHRDGEAAGCVVVVGRGKFVVKRSAIRNVPIADRVQRGVSATLGLAVKIGNRLTVDRRHVGGNFGSLQRAGIGQSAVLLHRGDGKRRRRDRVIHRVDERDLVVQIVIFRNDIVRAHGTGRGKRDDNPVVLVRIRVVVDFVKQIIDGDAFVPRRKRAGRKIRGASDQSGAVNAVLRNDRVGNRSLVDGQRSDRGLVDVVVVAGVIADFNVIDRGRSGVVVTRIVRAEEVIGSAEDRRGLAVLEVRTADGVGRSGFAVGDRFIIGDKGQILLFDGNVDDAVARGNVVNVRVFKAFADEVVFELVQTDVLNVVGDIVEHFPSAPRIPRGCSVAIVHGVEDALRRFFAEIATEDVFFLHTGEGVRSRLTIGELRIGRQRDNRRQRRRSDDKFRTFVRDEFVTIAIVAEERDVHIVSSDVGLRNGGVSVVVDDVLAIVDLRVFTDLVYIGLEERFLRLTGVRQRRRVVVVGRRIAVQIVIGADKRFDFFNVER